MSVNTCGRFELNIVAYGNPIHAIRGVVQGKNNGQTMAFMWCMLPLALDAEWLVAESVFRLWARLVRDYPDAPRHPPLDTRDLCLSCADALDLPLP